MRGMLSIGAMISPIWTPLLTEPLPTGETVLFTLEHLSPDTAYVYRFKHRRIPAKNSPGAKPEPQEAEAFSSSEYYTFHTPRVPGDTFTFTIQADSHLDASVTPAMYSQTLANVLADRPDFHIDLGDTFMTDKRGREYKDTLPQYVCSGTTSGCCAPRHRSSWCSATMMAKWVTPATGLAAWRLGRSLSGRSTSRLPRSLTTLMARPCTPAAPRAKGQGANYYEFTWGATVQFIVLDPFWFTTTGHAVAVGAGRGAGARRRKRMSPAQTRTGPVRSARINTTG